MDQIDLFYHYYEYLRCTDLDTILKLRTVNKLHKTFIDHRIIVLAKSLEKKHKVGIVADDMGQTIRNLRRHMYKVTIKDDEAEIPIMSFFYLPSPSVLAACAVMNAINSWTLNPFTVTVEVEEGPDAGSIPFGDIGVIDPDHFDEPPDLKDYMHVQVFGGDYYIPKTSGDLCIIQDVLNYANK